jgi:uncharacterized membrane protein
MKGYVTAGLAALAGAAIFEAALIPAVIVGGAAVLVPKYLPKHLPKYLPNYRLKPRRRSGLPQSAPARGRAQPAMAVAVDRRSGLGPNFSLASLSGFGLKQAIAKTITFRIIVTTLDFTTNFVVIGELSTAAGLSTFNLFAGPLFYLTHEAAWNYLRPAQDAAIDVQIPQQLSPGAKAQPEAWGQFTISRALAKTITFRTIATVMDFTTNYVVVRDVATAAGLSAFGFVVGPFVYLAHEKVWEHYSSPKKA